VHDAVRCLVSVELIHRCFEQAVLKGSAIPAVAATDSIRILEGTRNVVTDRNNVRIIQTPQTFQTELLIPAFQRSYNATFTDEATVLEATGKQVFLIEGEYSNIKITRPVDLLIAESILNERGQ
jgi:2-C-methyl-D-erythritol 4-phosphate cytidylyltransferase